jgi:hypothetical protein
MLSVPFSKKVSATATAGAVEVGRHIGTVIQIVGLGNQPAFTAGQSPVASVAVVVQLANCQVAKKMTLSDSPLSNLCAFLNAALPDPDGYEGDDPLPLTLGCPVAVEIVANGKFTNVQSFHRPMDFEIGDAPKVAPDNLLFLEGAESLVGDEGKVKFQKLHREVRGWLSRRVRGN